MNEDGVSIQSILNTFLNMRSKIELGDIFTLQTKSGIACLQCVEIPFDVKNEVELIRVFYELFSSGRI
jgi:hypothetical protein